MAAHECQAIEKCIKDLLFSNIPSTQPPVTSSHSHLPIQSSVKDHLLDNRCLVSNIEENAHLAPNTFNTNIPFSELTSLGEKQHGRPFVSELIDYNVLTDFAAKHLDDSNFHAASMVLNCEKNLLPHPDLEENSSKGASKSDYDPKKPDISVLLDNISNKIKNSPNFLIMPENPLIKPQHSSPNKIAANDNQNANSSFKLISQMSEEEKKERKKQKKLKKNRKREVPKKSSDNDASFEMSPRENPLGKEENNMLVKNQPNLVRKAGINLSKKGITAPSIDAEKPPEIKMKKNVPSSNGREYTLSLRKGNFNFMCDVCEYNCTDEAAIMKHLKSTCHKEQKALKETDMHLPFLPDPLPSQVEAVTDLLIYRADCFGLAEKDFKIRKTLAERLKKSVEEHVTSCTVDLIGSSVSGFGHKYSEVDFILKVPADINAADALSNTYELLLKDNGYKKVFNDFKKKIPQIRFFDIEFSLSCTLIIDNGTSLQLAKLLSAYSSLDPRVLTLGTVLRNWANICEIDKQDAGTLPSFCYALLLIYFLQQVQPPILPVLHEVDEYSDSLDFLDTYLSEKRWSTKNTDPIGLLWIKFFHFYNFVYKTGEDVVCIRSSKKVSCSEKNWGTKFYAIEDPFVRRNLAYVIPTHQVYRYIQQCFVRTYRYFAFPQLKNGPLKVGSKGDPLRIGMEGFPSTPDCISECVFKEDTHEETDTSENSFSNDTFDVNEHLEDHDPDLPLDDLISTINKLTLDQIKTDEEDEAELAENYPMLYSAFTLPTEINKGLNKDSKPVGDAIAPSSSKTPTSEIQDMKKLYYWNIGENKVDRNDFSYEFHTKTFKGDKSVPLVCKLCQGKGHLKNDCPAEKLPPTFPLPAMTPDFLKALDKVCTFIREDNMPSAEELACRNSDMLEIQAYIRETFPDATLSLFGSFCNGFGFKKSDMDFCLTFDGKDNGKDLECVDVIEKVAAKLCRHPKIDNVIPVVSAKVPIVKFTHRDSRLEGDISLYNTLAQHNTKMLDAYSKIDPRVQTLGYVLKYFAKNVGICDASRGSLSSYAYVLMVIFFLQQRDPPVIPVLQELHDERKPVYMVEGWNAWFYEDFEKLKETWQDFGKNKETIGELWLGLLSFYACDFDVKEYVVCIRQKAPLTRFRKLWISDQIAIEDPFDLSHNLGAGLSRKMNSYILRAFIRGRERFGHPISLERMRGQEKEYLFDRRYLTSGREPPNDRGCRYCGKIGHIAKDCPKKIMKKERKSVKSRDYNKNSLRASFENRPSSQRDRQNPRGQQANRRSSASDQPSRNNYGSLNMPMMNADIRHEGQQRMQHQMGVPSHRFPPPGFQSNSHPGFKGNPPPGFKSNALQQNLMNYLPPFSNQRPTMSPFPGNSKMKDISPSMSKQYSASPPKHAGVSPPKPSAYQEPLWNFRQVMLPESPVYPPRHMQQDRYNANHGQPQWRNRRFPSRDSHVTHHQPDHQQNVDRPRTNSDSNLYNSQHSSRW